MPYLYIFSEGEVLRAGVTERLRRSPLIVLGYIFFSLGMFAIAAPAVPAYWFFLFKNLHRKENVRSPPVPPFEDGKETGRPDAEASTESGGVKTCTWCGRECAEDATVCPIDGYPLVRHKKAT
jgi:hypothetical protein